MNENFKLKYRKLCNNIDLFYKIMEEWNAYLTNNPLASLKEKLQKLDKIKEIEPKLYQAMQEDLYAERY